MTPILAATFTDTLIGIAFLVVLILGFLGYIIEAITVNQSDQDNLRARLAREAEQSRNERVNLLELHRHRALALQEKQTQARASLQRFHTESQKVRQDQRHLSQTVLAAHRTGESIDRTREKLSRITR